MSFFVRQLKKYLFFEEPEKLEKFILKPGGRSAGDKGAQSFEKVREKKTAESEKPPEAGDEVKSDIDANLAHMKDVYSIPVNSDIILREFDITYGCRSIRAFIIFFDGMTNTEVINNYILKPLMVNSVMPLKDTAENLEDYVVRQLMPHCQVKIEKGYKKAVEAVNFGGCALFVDGLSVCFAADVKGWEHRGVEKPNNEIIIKGPQEAFNEVLRTNCAQLRKRLKDEDLIAEDILVGKVSRTPCSIVYIKDVANESLVAEVRRRLEGISVDYMLDAGALEQLIEDSTFYPSPQMISTERPDYVAELLVSGRVAIIVDGSPNVLVVPITAYDLMHSPEDNYIRFPYVNMLRYIRYVAGFLALLLPGLYVAITNYHHEMIPTDLLLAIEASREKVPFPSLVEILLMELSFELIREAGLRVPGPIGPTLGIIGALILGQAAVAANIVSPVLIIIVALTGIGSFAIPNYSLAYSVRIMRFAFIFLGALAGFLGITVGLFVIGSWSAALKSFGVPFMSPFGPKTSGKYKNVIFRAPEWKMEDRPDYLNPKKKKKQAEISMKWKQDTEKKKQD
ncbi:MAG TPA: spore germination protein [Clostridiales bacterium]|nr:spore germination protein [Clostridiales bacterium]HPV02146.1 spore germination protein [Clostridiales bacterium]